jgi:PKD repeat protein
MGLIDKYEVDDTPAEANVITPDSKIAQQHNFHDDGAPDEDWVKFYALADNEPYEFKAANLGLNCDVVMGLYESDGTTLITQWDNPGKGVEEVHAWTCDPTGGCSEGIVYVKLSNSDPADDGDDTGYDLSVERPTGFGIPTNVYGYIKDSSSEADLPGVVVLVGGGTGISGANGYYDIWFNIENPTENHNLTATRSEYFSFGDTVTVMQGNRTTKDFYMDPTDLQPTANFTGAPTSGIKPLTVNFTNSSTGGDAPLSYEWDFEFNSGVDSTDTNPSYIYNNAGTYSVKLTVTDIDLDTDSLTRTDYIDVCYPLVNIVGDTTAFSLLQAAYDDPGTGNGDIIQMREGTFAEDIVLDRDISITIRGGYNCDHTSDTGLTVINGNMTINNGNMTINNGTVVIENVNLQ